jgi:hypothetical protein
VSDLERFLRGLDNAEPRDLRDRIRPRPPSPDGGRPFARWLTIAAVLAVSAIVLVWAAQPFDGSSPGSPPSPSLGPVPDDRLSVSGSIEHGQLRCTVSIPESVLAGGSTGSTFQVRNISDHEVNVSLGVNGHNGTLRIYRGDTLLVDSADEHIGILGPPPIAHPIEPGATAELGALNTAVLWAGPLRVVPVCAGTELPQVQVQVMAPGEAPDNDTAVQQAVADIGDPLVDCRPVDDGGWVTGVIHRGQPPSDQSFDARCGARVLINPGFDTVIVAIISPPDAPDVDLTPLPQAIQAIPQVDLPQDTPIALTWWIYVVRSDAIVNVMQRHVSLRCEGSAETSGSGIASCRFRTVSATSN